MPIPTTIADLSAVIASNSPAGSDPPSQGDDYIRAISAFIRQIYDGGATSAGLADTTTSTLGDFLVGAINTASGGSARTQHARNEEELRTTDFSTIQAALTAANGKTLRWIGSYSITAETTLPASINIVGDRGATLSCNVTDIALKIPGSANGITIDGLTISGTCSRAIGTELGAATSNIRILNCDISGATIIGAGYSAGFFIDGVAGLWIDGCHFHGNGRGAISGSQADNIDCLIYTSPSSNINIGSGNRFVSTAVSFNCGIFAADGFTIGASEFAGARGGASNNKGYGLFLYAAGGPGLVKNGRVTKPYVHDTQGSGIYLASVEDTIIESPRCKSVASTQSDVSIPVGGVVVNGGYRNTVINPQIDIQAIVVMVGLSPTVHNMAIRLVV
jgi:hypothetical protein